MRKPIPTHIVTGFLGSGKTTAILDLLRHKPAAEKWAVLVNEFGEIGIDGKILAGSGAEIREVAGGCMCCVAGLPMQVALNNLIARVQPDRLLIEPSGLGHPQEIIDTLRGGQYAHVLDLHAVICLVDPRRLRDERYRQHAIFSDQLRAADIVVANKTDLCGAEERALFERAIAALPQSPQATGWVEQGRLQPAWLQCERATQNKPASLAGAASSSPSNAELPLPIVLLPGTPFARREQQREGLSCCGWQFAANTRFDFQRLLSVVSGLPVRRLKAAMQTERGSFVFNADDGVLSVTEMSGNIDSVIECIAEPDTEWPPIEQMLLAARC